MKDIQTEYKKHLKLGKKLVLQLNQCESAITSVREAIAKLVIEVSTYANVTKFCAELQKYNSAIRYPTVMGWVQRSKKIDKIQKAIPPKQRETKKGITTINRLLNQNRGSNITSRSTKKDIIKAFNSEKHKSKEEIGLDYMITLASKIQFSICDSLILKALPVKKLIGLHDILCKVTEKLELHFMTGNLPNEIVKIKHACVNNVMQ